VAVAGELDGSELLRLPRGRHAEKKFHGQAENGSVGADAEG
jgi:hypothetical protein